MKYIADLGFACATVLLTVLTAVAQTQPTPVIRMGDWVEIGNEVFMNFIATTDIRYNTTQNYDFESDIRDRVASRSPTASTLYAGEGDLLQNESRLGVDMRYQKNLRMRVLAEAQYIMDGNLIDDRHNTNNGGANPSSTGISQSTENNGFHIERFWIDYTFPNTPLRMRVGADLWVTDQAQLLGDDDPRFAVFLELGPKKEFQLYGAAVLEREAARLGLQNDNDFIYYTFGASYAPKPHKIALDVAYFRDRFSGASEQGGDVGQQFDTVLISPSYTGVFGPIRLLAQFSTVIGSAQGNNAAGRPDYDVFAWAVVAHVQANLAGGLIQPFIGIIYGSGDDDPSDDKLGGFTTTPNNQITLLTGNGHMGYLTTSRTVDGYGPAAPARAGFAGGNLFRHTTSNPFSDRLGNTAHSGINAAYSNPGTLLIPVGLTIAPLKGHALTMWYMYTALTDSSVLEAAAAAAGTPTRIDEFLYHEISAAYNWVLSSHFDIRLAGTVLIPGDGVKDIAATVTCPDGQPCQGEDPALRAELRFRGRF